MEDLRSVKYLNVRSDMSVPNVGHDFGLWSGNINLSDTKWAP